MKYRIVWTDRAVDGLTEILNYLDEHWSAKQIDQFWRDMDHFFELLVLFPNILAPSTKRKNLHRGPVNKHTLITYSVNPSRREIVLINIRAAKQTQD